MLVYMSAVQYIQCSYEDANIRSHKLKYAWLWSRIHLFDLVVNDFIAHWIIRNARSVQLPPNCLKMAEYVLFVIGCVELIRYMYEYAILCVIQARIFWTEQCFMMSASLSCLCSSCQRVRLILECFRFSWCFSFCYLCLHLFPTFCSFILYISY
jgi:hypothetical protein